MKRTKHLSRFEALLDTDPCSPSVNSVLTLTMRLGFRRINPPGDAATGTHPDYGRRGETERRIVRWTDEEWARWKLTFCQSAEAFWDNKFWVDNRRGALAFRGEGAVYVPNAQCRFRLIGSDAGSGPQHHRIDVVRLADDEPWFGSHAQLYDSRDIDPVRKASDDAGNPIMQRAHVHEVGHLLGLGHVAIGQPACPPTGNTNAPPCYGVTDADKNSVMGAGMRLDAVHGAPWLDVFEAFVRDQPHTNAYRPPPGKARPAAIATSLVYPRTVAEFEAGAVLTVLPPGR